MLASHGGRVATRHAPSHLPHRAGGGSSASRRIHILSHIFTHPRLPPRGTAHKLFTQAHNRLSQFFYHLTAPGIRVPNGTFMTRSLHGTAQGPSIPQRLSFPVRTALSRPLRPYFLPHTSAVPRTVTQVGLGTARHFSSGRPIFQNLVDNIPVVGRAFYEADWEIKMRKESAMMMKPTKGGPKKKLGGKEMLKPNARDFSMKENKYSAKEAKTEAQLDQYFATPTIPDVTTYLVIPLAPTPTARTPLSENTASNRLLPLPELASLHASHEMHSLRVSALFSRLDAANVWARGVECSAFSHGGGPNGVCTMLKVEFVGWTKAEVRSVLGESGTGWCVLDEVKGSREHGLTAFGPDDDDTLSDTSSVLSNMFEDGHHPDLPAERVDPAQLLFLPRLDFSSSFHAASTPVMAASRPTDLYPAIQPDSNFDPWLDTEVLSEGELSETDSWVAPPSINDWYQ